MIIWTWTNLARNYNGFSNLLILSCLGIPLLLGLIKRGHTIQILGLLVNGDFELIEFVV